MTSGSRYLSAVAAIALTGAVSANPHASAQSSPAPPSGRPLMVEDVFTNVQALKGIGVDDFMLTMGIMSAAVGSDCVGCHPSAGTDHVDWALDTPRKRTARRMVQMVTAINRDTFNGRQVVTCWTCHRGRDRPITTPTLDVVYGPPADEVDDVLVPAQGVPSVDQVLNKYLQALGGADRVAKFTSFSATGTYEGFDTGMKKVPVELYAKSPAQQTMVVHLSIGQSTRAFDGRNGWMAGPDTPLPLLTLTEGNLDRARLEALVAFPTGLRQAFPRWRVGRTAIGDKEVRIVQGVGAAQALANFYFDDSGLLVRLVRWTRTPVGFVPTQIDYSNYRDVNGVKVPFTRTVSQTYMQMTVELANVQANSSIDDARFAQPAPFQQR